MRRLLIILATAAVVSLWLSTHAGFAQNGPSGQSCPNGLSSTVPSLVTQSERAKTGVPTAGNPLFKNIGIKPDKPASSAARNKERQREIEINIEFEWDGTSLLSNLPFVKGLFSSPSKPSFNEATESSDHFSDVRSTQEATLTASETGTQREVTHAAGLAISFSDENPNCCEAMGGCCARPWVVETQIKQCCDSGTTRPSPTSCTKAACCQNPKDQSAPASTTKTAKPSAIKPCCCLGKNTATCQSTECVTPKPHLNADVITLANFTEQASVAEQQRLEFIEELVELKIENAELKMALEAAKQQLDMLRQLADLREQNVLLKAELHIHQAMNQTASETSNGHPFPIARQPRPTPAHSQTDDEE